MKVPDLITGIIIPKCNSKVIEEFLETLDEIGCSSLYIMPIIETTEFTDITKKYNAFMKGAGGVSLESAILTKVKEIDFLKQEISVQTYKNGR